MKRWTLLVAAFATVASAAPLSLPMTGEEAASRRAQQRLFMLGEFGWNGLAGVGLIGGYHLHPHLTVELGTGFSPVKWKFGGRLRANLFTSEWTPFLSGGLAYGLGDPNTEAVFLGGAPLRYRLLRSPYMLVTAGLDYTGEDSVIFLVNVGWSFLLAQNVEITRGAPTEQQQLLMDLAFKSGPVLSRAFGYSF